MGAMSVYTTAIQGMQVQIQAVAQYADTIAQRGADAQALISQLNEGVALPEDIVSLSDGSLEAAVVGLETAKHLFAANAKVIETQREMEEHLLDILS